MYKENNIKIFSFNFHNKYTNNKLICDIRKFKTYNFVKPNNKIFHITRKERKF